MRKTRWYLVPMTLCLMLSGSAMNAGAEEAAAEEAVGTGSEAAVQENG